MRSDPRDYELVAPGSLQMAVELLAGSPREWLPIAGGTDIMVQYAAGKLASRKLISIWNLAELRHMEVLANEIRVGAGCTYTDIREHEVLSLIHIFRSFSLASGRDTGRNPAGGYSRRRREDPGSGFFGATAQECRRA